MWQLALLFVQEIAIQDVKQLVGELAVQEMVAAEDVVQLVARLVSIRAQPIVMIVADKLVVDPVLEIVIIAVKDVVLDAEHLVEIIVQVIVEITVHLHVVLDVVDLVELHVLRHAQVLVKVDAQIVQPV